MSVFDFITYALPTPSIVVGGGGGGRYSIFFSFPGILTSQQKIYDSNSSLSVSLSGGRRSLNLTCRELRVYSREIDPFRPSDRLSVPPGRRVITWALMTSRGQPAAGGQPPPISVASSVCRGGATLLMIDHFRAESLLQHSSP